MLFSNCSCITLAQDNIVVYYARDAESATKKKQIREFDRKYGITHTLPIVEMLQIVESSSKNSKGYYE